MGVPNLARNELKTLKFIWLISILVSTRGCIYLCILTVLSYLEYTVVTQIQVVNDPSAEFPTVTKCNTLVSAYAVNRSRRRIERVEKEVNEIYNTSIYSFVFNDPNTFRSAITTEALYTNLSDRERRLFSPSLDQMIIVCSYGSAYTSCNSSWFESFFDGFLLLLADLAALLKNN